jgi:hypothetical protein
MESFRDFEREGDGDCYEGDYDVGDAFGEHNIEYWIYDGTRLVPASPAQAEQLRDLDARRRLELWQAQERRRERMRAWSQPWTPVKGTLVALGVQVRRRLPGAAGGPTRRSPATPAGPAR